MCDGVLGETVDKYGDVLSQNLEPSNWNLWSDSVQL